MPWQGDQAVDGSVAVGADEFEHERFAVLLPLSMWPLHVDVDVLARLTRLPSVLDMVHILRKKKKNSIFLFVDNGFFCCCCC